MWNIVIGAILLVGGLSGKMVMIFTESSALLAAVGAGLVIWGVVQVAGSKKRR